MSEPPDTESCTPGHGRPHPWPLERTRGSLVQPSDGSIAPHIRYRIDWAKLGISGDDRGDVIGMGHRWKKKGMRHPLRSIGPPSRPSPLEKK